MIWPSRELYERLLGSTAGLWAQRLAGGEHVLVAKMTRAVIKHVFRGAPVELVVFTVRVAEQYARVVGLRVHDDRDDPTCICAPVTTRRDLEALDALLGSGTGQVEFFDDACVPSLTAVVRFSPSPCRVTCAPLATLDPQVNDALLDAYGTVLTGKLAPSVAESALLPVSVVSLTPARVSLGASPYVLGAAKEGTELESSTELLLDGILRPLASIRSPLLANKPNKPELCDVLGFGPQLQYALVVQAKVDGILAAKSNRTPARRVATIEKNLRAAIRQGKGAIRELRRGTTIQADALGPDPVVVPPQHRVHVVVVLSEMDTRIDWEQVATALLAESKEGLFFHVFDMLELQRLVSASQLAGPECAAVLLDSNLEMHWRAMRDNGTALIYGRSPE